MKIMIWSVGVKRVRWGPARLVRYESVAGLCDPASESVRLGDMKSQQGITLI